MNQTKSTFIIVIFLLVISLIFMSFSSPEIQIESLKINRDRNALVKYGEEIFQKENCLQCHTLRVEYEGSKRISLDGYEGRRSSAWLYQLLLDPNTIIADIQMPSFSHLHETEYREETLRNALLKNGDNGILDIDLAWQDLYAQSDSLSLDLTRNFESHKRRTEVIALIAFLQQIPSTQEKMKRDSIANIELQEELNVWNDLYKNSDSLIIVAARDPLNIEQGGLLFRNNCAICHGSEGEGKIGPNLTDDYWIYGGENSEIARSIVEGRSNGMPSHKYRLTPTEVGKLTSYITSFKGTNHSNGRSPEGKQE